jgi:hypothetical protein
MKSLPGLLLALLSLSSAWSQIDTRISIPRTNYLLYEPVTTTVTLRNTADYDLILRSENGHPWLSFLMRTSDGNPVRRDQEADFAPLTLKPGEAKSLAVNLTPLHAFREPGQYKVSAVVNVAGQEYVSDSFVFNVANGKKIWTTTKTQDEEEITYSLIRFAPSLEATFLYLQLEKLKANAVLANYQLGETVSYTEPQVYFDAQNRLHILHRQGNGVHRYTRLNTDGRIESQVNYAAVNESIPFLRKTAEGDILVAGGRAENQFNAREKLSESQKLLSSVSSPTASLR